MSWFNQIFRLRSSEAFELAVRRVAQRSLAEVRSSLSPRLAAMNRSEARGYIRGRARAAVRATMLFDELQSPQLLEQAIHQVVQQLTREWLLQPVPVARNRAA